MSKPQQESWKESEAELFRLLVENVKDYAVFVVDPQGRVQSWNPGAERLLGYREDEIIGQSARLFFTPEDRQAGVPEHEIRQAVEGGRSDDDRWHVRKDGSRLWAGGMMTPLWDDDHQLRGFAKIMRDRTEWKLSQEAAEEQTRLAALIKDVGLALSQSDKLPDMLRQCVEAVVRHLDGAFARIWTIDPTENIMELRASAGMYTHLDGPHSRVPVGKYKIGLIAQERKPHLTNEVVGDPRVSDQEWAKREGMVAFAGYPLVVDGGVIGVMAMFARQPLTDATLGAMASVANGIAVGVERKTAEEQRRAQQEWLSVTLASIGDAVITTDALGRVTFLNGVAQGMTGWALADAEGQPLEAVFPIVNEQTRQPVENPVEKVLREGVIVGLANHTVLVALDGTERPIDDSAAPIRDAAGRMLGVVLIFRDVTEQRRADRELRESEARKSAVLQTALDCIITMDQEGRVVEFNPTAEKTFGYSRAEVIGQELSSLIIPPSLRDRHRVGMAHYLATGEGPVLGRRLELPAMRADGTEFPAELAITRIPTEGPPLFTAYLRDISERKRTEAALLEAHRELENRVAERTAELVQANEFLKALLENVQTGVVACDAAGVLTLFNGVTRALHGLPEEPIPPEQWAERYRLYRPDGQTPMAKEDVPLYRVLQGERVQDAEMVIAPLGVPPRTVQVSGQAFHDDQGTKLGAVVSMQDITARKQAEAELRQAHDELERRVEVRTEQLGRTHAALRESEEKLRLLADTIPQLAWMARPDGHIFWYNRRWYEYTGTTPEQMEGWGWQTVHDPNVLPKVLERWKASIASGEPFDMVFPLKGGDDTFRSFLTRVNPLRDETGSILYWFGTNTDVTELRQTREALATSEERLRLALDAGHMGVWDWNIRTGELNWSDSLEPLHGLAPGTFGGTFDHFQQLIHLEDRKMVNAAIQQALESGGEFHIEFRNVWSNGGIHWIAGSGKVFPGDDGQPLRMIGIGLDVTQRKRAEQTARFLADASAALAVLVDFDSTLQKVASLAVPSFADWATVDLAEADGSLRRVSVSHIDPAKVQLAQDVHRRFPPDPAAPHGVWTILRTGRSEIVPEITDELLVQSTKEVELLSIMRELGLKSYIGVPLTVRGNTLGVITFINAESGHQYDRTDLAVAEDLASRAAIAIENAQLYQELRQNDQRKDEFLATLAHELRNPLAPIRNGLQVLRLAGGDGEMVSEARMMMERQLSQMVRLVDDLLDVSRITRDKLELKKQRVELLTVVHSAVETSRPLIEQAGHTITVTLPPTPIYLDADLTRLAQVFSNLLTNSAKYTPSGGRIWLIAEGFENEVAVTVRDNGLGIPAESLPKIFQMFSQVDRNMERAQGGLGIGLTLVRRLVEMHGGTVEARSDGPGQGSEFTVRLPALKLTQQTVTLQGEDSAVATAGLKQRILVVDDNHDSAMSLGIMLKLMGNEIQTAHDGLAAVAAAEEFRPDIILLDIGLPKLNGYDACRRVRQQPWSKGMVIVALTGWGQEDDRRRSKEAGFDHHLVKPVEIMALQQLLSERPKEN